MNRIAILGLGRMGIAIAENAVNSGYEVYAYNRSKKLDIDSRIKLTSDPQVAIRSSSTVVLALSDEKAILEVLFENNKIRYSFLDESVVIDTTTHSPDFAKFLYEKFLKINVAYLDTPVSGGPEKARQGTLSVMVGGGKDNYEKYKSYLSVIGKHIFYMGESGTGQAAKLANQILVGISQLATCEAVLFGKLYGLDLHQLLKVIKCSAGNSVVFERSAPQMIDGKFTNDFQTYLINKDLNNVSSSAGQKDLKLLLTELTSRILNVHTKSCFREVDVASIILQYENILEQVKSK